MEYFIAETSIEALDKLNEAQGKAVILAGGTDLIVDEKRGKIHPQMFIDITSAKDMLGIRVEGEYLVIGGSATLTDIARSEEVKKYYPSLAKGCGTVGSLQIRNSATLTGNVVSAQPAADGAMALAPLNASFTVLSKSGERTVKMEEMYKGFGKSSIDPSCELITKILIPLPKSNEAAAFERLELRKSLSLPMLNCAAMVRLQDHKVVWARINMAPVGVGPMHAKAAEEYLTGRELTEEVMTEAGKLSLKDAAPRSNPLRGSREYRLETLPVMILRVLEDCKRQLEEKEG